MTDQNTDSTPASPLAEAEVLSLDTLFDRINDKLIAGMPETITSDDTTPIVNVLREQRLKFLAEQDKLGRAPAAPRKRKPDGVADALKSYEVEL